MSAPPPGGTPPPQQPPTQPYPQPYPQQPYYPQAAPPPQPKKSNTALIVVIVVVVVVVVVIAMAWFIFNALMAPVNNAQNFTINSVSWTIDYPGANQYFGASPITTCSTCPIHGTIVSPITYILSLTNADTVQHNVTSVTLTGFNFQLVDTTPTISSASPMVFQAGQTRSITMTIEGFTLTGSTTLVGTIVTT